MWGQKERERGAWGGRRGRGGAWERKEGWRWSLPLYYSHMKAIWPQVAGNKLYSILFIGDSHSEGRQASLIQAHDRTTYNKSVAIVTTSVVLLGDQHTYSMCTASPGSISLTNVQ